MGLPIPDWLDYNPNCLWYVHAPIPFTAGNQIQMVMRAYATFPVQHRPSMQWD